MILAAKAMNSKDMKTLEEYIDVDSIILQCVDQTIEKVENKGGIIGQLISGAASLAKPQIVRLTKTQFQTMVNNGSFKEITKDLNFLPSSTLLAKLLATFGAAKYTDRMEVLEHTKTESDETLKIKVRIRPDGPWVPLHVHSVKYKKHVRIDKILNLKEIKGILLKETISTIL